MNRLSSPETVTITLERNEAALLRRFLTMIRAFDTELDTTTQRCLAVGQPDWIEHIDRKLANSLADDNEDILS